jgi:hypothetical protein
MGLLSIRMGASVEERNRVWGDAARQARTFHAVLLADEPPPTDALI